MRHEAGGSNPQWMTGRKRKLGSPRKMLYNPELVNCEEITRPTHTG